MGGGTNDGQEGGVCNLPIWGGTAGNGHARGGAVDGLEGEGWVRLVDYLPPVFSPIIYRILEIVSCKQADQISESKLYILIKHSHLVRR